MFLLPCSVAARHMQAPPQVKQVDISPARHSPSLQQLPLPLAAYRCRPARMCSPSVQSGLGRSRLLWPPVPGYIVSWLTGHPLLQQILPGKGTRPNPQMHWQLADCSPPAAASTAWTGQSTLRPSAQVAAACWPWWGTTPPRCCWTPRPATGCTRWRGIWTTALQRPGTPQGFCWPQATRQGKAQHQPAGQCALPTERRHLHHLSTCSGTVHWLQVYLSGEAVSALLVGTP